MNVLRLAIALSDVESKKFNKILSSVIISILKQNSQNQRFSSSDIQRMITDNYGLDFSTIEIENAIDDDLNFFETYQEKSIRYCSLSGKALSKQSTTNIKCSLDIDKCVDNFLNENQEAISEIGKIDKQIAKEAINKYVYNSFHSNREELAYLLKGKMNSNTSKPEKRYHPREIRIIRLFLDWSNDEKNKMLFDLVRAAYNYCILTIKENAEESMFSYKKLYLDTNVIFSLAGINGKERMYSTKAFIKKSKELHSNIFYTSSTADECHATLESLIEKMASIVKKDSYLSYEEMKAVFPSSNPTALFELYREWACLKPSRNGDYHGFLIHMNEVLDETLDDLSLEPIESVFLEKHEEQIENLRTSLANYKNSLGRKHSDNATRNDARNFAYIDSIRNKANATIKNQDIFFISSDTGLCRWAEGRCSGYINVFISPSVMYSMMLRFSNRTKDDYKTFNDFVLLSFSSENITEDEQQAKEELVRSIDELEVPDDAKRRVLYFANRELNKHSHKKEEFSKEGVSDAINVGLGNYFEEYESFKNKEKDEAVEKTGKEKYSEGYNTAIEGIAISNTNRIVKRKEIRNKCITAGLFIVAAALLVLCVIIFVREKDIKSVTAWVLAGFSFLSFASTIFSLINNFKKWIFKIKRDEIYKKELEKQKKLAIQKKDSK